jgi:hypothetical protein
MNYPYLSGYLQSAIRQLAFDYKFQKLDIDGKMEYVEKILKEADEAAANYAKGGK